MRNMPDYICFCIIFEPLNQASIMILHKDCYDTMLPHIVIYLLVLLYNI